jgi:hypothetical protein
VVTATRNGLAPEVGWVIEVLRSRYGGPPVGDAAALDASVVLETVRRNAIGPLVHASLPPTATLPAGLREELAAIAGRTRLENLARTRELLRIVDVLESAGIPALPYKGPVLAQLAYGDVGLRRFGDLDVLVARRDVPAAIRAMGELGYRSLQPISERKLRALIRSGHDWALVDEHGNAVEVQWSVASRAHAVPRGVEALIARARTVSIGGREVRSLDPTDQVLVLALHGGIHLWVRLSWVCDMAQGLAVEGVDPDRALRLARSVRARRALLLGVALVDRILGSRPIASLADRAADDPAVQALVDTLEPALLAAGGPDIGRASDRVRTRVRMADRSFDGWIGAARAIVTPTPVDWEAVPLPDALLPLYYPVRLARVGAFVLRRRGDGPDIFDVH